MDRLRDTRWFWLPILIVISMGLGWWGFSAVEPGKPSEHYLYRSLQLFTLESGVPEQVPFPLNVARFMAPALLVVAGFFAFYELFRNSLVRFWLIFRKNHVVLCGLGPRSLQLAKDFKQLEEDSGRLKHLWGWRKRVVIIDNGMGTELLSEAEKEGFNVQHGKAFDVGLLKQVRVERAEYVIMVCDDDDDNIRAASAAHKLRENPDKLQKVFVHIQDRELQARFKNHKIFSRYTDRFEVKVFSTPDMVARQLMRNHPLEIGEDNEQIKDIRLVLIGFGQTGQAIAQEVLFLGHFADERKPHLTVVDKKMDDLKASSGIATNTWIRF